ncbi:MAG: APA family basic amino acid/polyamine antiporter [Verrucomicrobiales bacterium]|jgi:APA family basic amino acid/polyamine antiporter
MVDSPMPADHPASEKIGLLAATAIVVGNMVGVGVFTSLGYQLLGIGSGFSLVFLWLLGGIYSLMGALCYAELASALPRSGGEYHLLSRTLHPGIGFASGWLSSTVGFAAPVALAAIAFGSYLGNVLGYGEAGQSALAAGLILFVTACHLRDVTFGSRFQVVATSLKVALVIGLAGCGFALGENQGISFLPGAGSFKEILSESFATSFYFVTFSYSGWNAAAYIVGEVRDPQRSVPRALLVGTGFVTIIYVLLNAAFLYSTPIAKMVGKEEVGLVAARSIFGESGGNLVGVLIAVGLISAVSAMTWAGPRVGQVMGEDYRELRFLARRTRRGIPIIAILIQSSIAILLAVTQQFETVIRFIEFALVLSLMATVFGLVWLRWKQPDVAAGATFRCPFFPVVPLLFIVLSLYISVRALQRHPAESLWGLGTLVSGGVVYSLLVTLRRQK